MSAPPSPVPRLRRRRWLVPSLVLLAVGVLYLATRQHVFTIDSYYYIWDTEFGDHARLLHPHHLALQPLFRGWWQLWRWLEWPGRALVPLQILNVLLSLAGLAVAWKLLRRFVPHRGLASAWWAVLAVSYLGWSQATQVDSLPLFSLGAVSLLWWATRLAQESAPTGRGALALSATLIGGILSHQVLVLWALPLAWMYARALPPDQRWRQAARWLLGTGGVVLGCYLAAGLLATGQADPAVLWEWFTGYEQEFAHRCGRLANMVSPDVPRGLAAALLSGGPLKPYLYGGRSPDADLLARLLPFLLVFAVVFGGLAAWRGGRDDAPGSRWAARYILLLALVSALFAAWWEPSQRKFWSPVVLALVTLAAHGWWRLGAGRPAALVVPVAALAAVILSYNLVGGILPRHRAQDSTQPLVVFVARFVQPQDVVILREDRVWQAALYFRPEKPIHGLPGPFSDRNDPERTVFEAALAAAHEALVGGHVMYVADTEWDDVRKHLEADLGPLPEPEVLFLYGDSELGPPDQQLLAVRLALG